jgi:hypothetical protein
VPKPRDATRDRYAPLPSDPPGVAAWRERMGCDAAKAIYKERAATAECANAQARNRALKQFVVRGLEKVKAIALYALAHNMACTWWGPEPPSARSFRHGNHSAFLPPTLTFYTPHI